MAPHLAKVDASIDPGLVMLNWTSLNIETYIDSVYDALGEFELLINRANDLVAYRIDAVLEEMSVIPLIELPTQEPKTIEEFLKSTQVKRRALMMKFRNYEARLLSIGILNNVLYGCVSSYSHVPYNRVVSFCCLKPSCAAQRTRPFGWRMVIG
jgi:hypothetical protein